MVEASAILRVAIIRSKSVIAGIQQVPMHVPKGADPNVWKHGTTSQFLLELTCCSSCHSSHSEQTRKRGVFGPISDVGMTTDEDDLANRLIYIPKKLRQSEHGSNQPSVGNLKARPQRTCARHEIPLSVCTRCYACCVCILQLLV